MHLYRLLSERRRWFGRRRYRLYLRLELDDTEWALLARQGVLDDELYCSPAADALDAKALSALELAEQTEDRAKARGLRIKGWRLARQAMHEVRCTVRQAAAGVATEADDVAEISMVLAGITAGLKGLQQKHDFLHDIEGGDEAVTPGAEPKAETSPGPAGWFNARRT